MRGGALPPALLASALGFAVAYVPRRQAVAGAALFVAAASVASMSKPDPHWTDAIFYGLWASVILTALSVHLRQPWPKDVVLALALNGGLWAGAVIAVAGVPLDLAKSLPFVLIAIPAAWLITKRLSIAVKVVASWLVAISMLAAAIPATTTTPGYVGDHLE